MLALVEPTIFSELVDRPHLGCAMLIASCQKKGIETTLIKGQTRFLKDMFVNHSEELWRLISDMKDDDPGIRDYKDHIQEIGLKQFQSELKSLYRYVIVEKNLRHYFNARMSETFAELFIRFGRIYFYYLENLRCDKLKIIDEYVAEITKTKPRYIGFSLQGGFGPLSRVIRKRVKELTGLPVIVGGPATSILSMNELDAIFEKEYVDYLVVGPGENALPSLIDALEHRKAPQGIPNVCYRTNGRVHCSHRAVIDDLDSLPFPDYHQFDLDLYHLPERVLSLQDARGCAWRQCAFCSHHASSFGTYKTFSIERVIETLRHLKKTYNCTHFVLDDDELPPARAKKISEAIVHGKVKGVFIYTLARLTAGYNNKALLRNLHAAGFTAIAWGMESASQKILNLIKKGTRVSFMGQILKKSARSGIANMCFVFFGFPGETKKDAQKTVEFLEAHADDIDHLNIQTFTIQAAAPIEKNPEKWGIKIKKDRAYSVKSGMSHTDAEDFVRNLKQKSDVGAIRITSGRINNKSRFGEQHTLHFLCSAHQLLFNREVLRYIKGRQWGRVFPVVVGNIEKRGAAAVLRPINIKETISFNARFEKEEVLGDMEERLTLLSNGTISIEEIFSMLCQEFKDAYAREMIHKRCTVFFTRIFTKDWGLAFALSWRPGNERTIIRNIKEATP